MENIGSRRRRDLGIMLGAADSSAFGEQCGLLFNLMSFHPRNSCTRGLSLCCFHDQSKLTRAPERLRKNKEAHRLKHVTGRNCSGAQSSTSIQPIRGWQLEAPGDFR
jgi:hypothetical protein